jgi:hypothetical protein
MVGADAQESKGILTHAVLFVCFHSWYAHQLTRPSPCTLHNHSNPWQPPSLVYRHHQHYMPSYQRGISLIVLNCVPPPHPTPDFIRLPTRSPIPTTHTCALTEDAHDIHKRQRRGVATPIRTRWIHRSNAMRKGHVLRGWCSCADTRDVARGDLTSHAHNFTRFDTRHISNIARAGC